MGERLSSIEAIMWRTGHDATLRMIVGTLMITDRSPTEKGLLERLESLVERAPRLRWRLDDPNGTRTRPGWVPSAEFNAANHLRTMAVASPGTRRQVLDLVALLEPAPFDPDRSPWDVTLIEGLEGGRAAIYLRAHHVLTDGLGGVSLMSLLVDEANPAPPPTVSETSPDAAPPSVAAQPSAPKRRPGTVNINVDLTEVAAPVAATVAAGVSFARTINPVGMLVTGIQRTLDIASSVSNQLVVTGGRHSPIPPSGALTSRFEMLSVEDARDAARRQGGSRNDLLVAGASSGLGLYHQHVGMPCFELRLALPTTQHRDSSNLGGSWVAPARLEVPTSAEHPGPHFGVVAERLARARREPVVRIANGVASVVGRLPTRLLAPALHSQANSVDFVATTLPGFRVDRHIGGALIEECYPFGPRLGCLANISAFGNGDRLDIGVALDPNAITDPAAFIDCLAMAFRAYDADSLADSPPPKPRPARTSA